MSIQFWFEFASTYSYPAAMRIEQAAEARGVTIEWRPFLLGPIFAAQGWNDSPFNIYPAKGAYMWRDLERVCANYGLPLRRPSRFPRSGLLAARIACAAEGATWLPEFVRAVCRANFAQDREISDRAVIAELLDALGEPAATLIERAETGEAKGRLRARTEEAQRRGIFGAPSFIVAGELFWGNDRLEDALDWHARHAA
jgi:2-hydroxychromene-2-carboxylate isomerase